jgi:membrane fusion protein, adhesin transport system
VLYQAHMAELAGITNGAAARAQEARRAVDEARAVLASRQAAAQAAQTQLTQIRPLVENGIEPQMTLVQAQSSAASTRSEAAAAAAALQRAQANVSTALAAGQEQISAWRARAGTELDTAQAELNARRHTMPALADRLRRTTVTSPIAGRVNRVLVNTPGGTVPPGSPLVEVVPSADTLVIEAQFNPKDIATVKIGQRAKVSITAYDSTVYGSLDGEVIAVSPDATVNERTGESHYLVRVRTKSTALEAHGGRRLPIGPGMLADVSLLGDSQSILSYIFSPIVKLKDGAFRE